MKLLPDKFLYQHHGFTLMEVLVATAIAGMAIGITVALLAQGHSQAFRGQRAKKASEIATRLINVWHTNKSFPEELQDEVDFAPGWKFKIFSRPLETELILPDGTSHVIKPQNIKEMILEIIPPDSKKPFSLTFWVSSKEIGSK